MLEFALAHPWMTFGLGLAAIVAVDNIVEYICKTARDIAAMSMARKLRERSEDGNETDEAP